MEEIIFRRQYIDTLLKAKDSEFIKVLTGVRRSGKSYILTMFKQKLLEMNVQEEFIISLNFEHPQNNEFLVAQKLLAHISEKINSSKTPSARYYLFFDEIQEVENWQKVITGLRSAYNCDIYITGSNAKLLSGELATYLSGRYIEIPVYPLSFEEFLTFKKEDHLDQDTLFNDYMTIGSFPSVALLQGPDLIEMVLQGIYDSIILKDVSLRGKIKDTSLLLRVVEFLFDAAGSPVSANSIANTLTSAGRKISNETVEKYLELLCDAFIFYKSTRFDIRGKERLKTLGKYYPIDPGLRNSVLGKRYGNYGQQLETIVYFELRRRGYKVFTGKLDQKEIDFVCVKNHKILYAQVAYDLPQTSNREIANLLHIPDNHKKILITANRLRTGEFDGIPCLHIVDFLLDKSLA